MNEIKEIKITEPTTFTSELTCKVTVTVENDMRVIMFEPVDDVLEVGKWYCPTWGCTILALPDGENVGFSADDNWMTSYKVTPLVLKDFKPADMSKVKELLIGEAENRKLGHKSYSIGPDGIFFGINPDGVIRDLFDFTTGLWAEIIKEPLYTNYYGTEFFVGCTCSSVLKSNLSILTHDLSSDTYASITSKELEEDNVGSEPMKDREQCLLWIKDNIHLLR